jgi:hypothetical protein
MLLVNSNYLCAQIYFVVSHEIVWFIAGKNSEGCCVLLCALSTTFHYLIMSLTFTSLFLVPLRLDKTAILLTLIPSEFMH